MDKESIEYLMGCNRDNTALIPWKLFNENRMMLEKYYHIEFDMGDKPGSVVRVMDLEMIER